jgi:cell division protein FtsB
MGVDLEERPASAPSRDAGGDASRTRRSGGGRRFLWAVWVVGVIAVGLAALVGVFPTRALLDKRDEANQVERELQSVVDENQAMSERINSLMSDDAAIEETARREHGMVRPGEDAYSILPPPVPSDLPTTWPFDVVRTLLD